MNPWDILFIAGMALAAVGLFLFFEWVRRNGK